MTFYEAIITEVPGGPTVVLDLGLVGLGRATRLLDTMAKAGQIQNTEAVELYDSVEVTGRVLRRFLDAVAADEHQGAFAREQAASTRVNEKESYQIYLSEV